MNLMLALSQAQPWLNLLAADGITIVGVLLVVVVGFTTCLEGSNSQKFIYEILRVSLRYSNHHPLCTVGVWVVEAVIDYGDGRVFDVVQIIELRDGKMWRDRWYFAEPFKAPEWRAQWVERMEA
jgi:hypothetical protein